MTADSELGPYAPPSSLVIPEEYVPDRAGTVSFFGGETRQGDWLLPRLFRVVAMFGSVKLDLTRARIGPGTSRIEVRAAFASVEIIMPPELRLECEGSAILASFEADTRARRPPPPDAPLVSVRGSAFFASVEVKVVDPQAPTWVDKLASRLTK